MDLCMPNNLQKKLKSKNGKLHAIAAMSFQRGDENVCFCHYN